VAYRNHAWIEIDAPADAVFPWLVEPGRRLQWVQGLESSERVAEGRYREVFHDHGVRTNVDVEVRRLEPPRAIELHIAAKQFEAVTRTRVSETAGRTRVESTIEAEYKGLVARAAAPVVTRHAQSSLERSLAKLKELVESADA
jgi:carbon monoxide dehydrogenase subunit G